MNNKVIKWEFLDIVNDEVPAKLPPGYMVLPKQESIHDDVEYWLGHCNFVITEDILNKLNHTKGVDVAKVLSKYRFVIGLGKLFNLTQVREEIDRTILEKTKAQSELDRIDNQSVKNATETLVQKLSSQYKYWVVYVLPNGQIEHCESQEFDETFMNQFECFSISQQCSNGVLIHSNEKDYS